MKLSPSRQPESTNKRQYLLNKFNLNYRRKNSEKYIANQDQKFQSSAAQKFDTHNTPTTKKKLRSQSSETEEYSEMSSPLVLKRKMNMFNKGNEITKETNKTPTPMKQKREIWVAKKEEPLNAS